MFSYCLLPIGSSNTGSKYVYYFMATLTLFKEFIGNLSTRRTLKIFTKKWSCEEAILVCSIKKIIKPTICFMAFQIQLLTTENKFHAHIRDQNRNLSKHQLHMSSLKPESRTFAVPCEIVPPWLLFVINTQEGVIFTCIRGLRALKW